MNARVRESSRSSSSSLRTASTTAASRPSALQAAWLVQEELVDDVEVLRVVPVRVLGLAHRVVLDVARDPAGRVSSSKTRPHPLEPALLELHPGQPGARRR